MAETRTRRSADVVQLDLEIAIAYRAYYQSQIREDPYICELWEQNEREIAELQDESRSIALTDADR